MINICQNRLIYPLYRNIIILSSGITKLFPGFLKGKSGTLHNIIGLLFFNGLGGLLLLLTQIKLANVMGASLYGVYSYYIAIGEVGSYFVRYGRNKTMVRDLIQNRDQEKSLIIHTVALGFINLLIYMVFVVCFSKMLSVEFNIATILLLITPCLISIDFQPVYESYMLMGWHSVYQFLQKILFLSIIWSVILCGDLSLINISISLFISWFIVLFIQYKEILSQLKLNVIKLIKINDIIELYKKNFSIALSCFLGVVFGPVIRLMLNNYVDSRAVGVYAAALQVYLISNFLLSQISRIGNPILAKVCIENYDKIARKKKVMQYLFVMVMSTLPFSFVLLLFSEYITCFFFTDEYVELKELLPIFSFYLIFLSIGTVFAQFLISMKKDNLYFGLFVFTTILTLVFGQILIPIYGVMGGVLSLCIPHSIGCLLNVLFSIQYLK